MFEPDPTPVPQAEIESALARIEAPQTAGDVLQGSAVPGLPLTSGEGSTPSAVALIEIGEASAQRLTSPVDTVGWRAARSADGIETFTAPNGQSYVRARPDEDADVIVSFTRTRGMSDMRLVLAGESATVRRAEKKKRREERELRKRGYDV